MAQPRPYAKPPPYEQLLAALMTQWDALADALERADPQAPSGCAGWTVADLERHCAATTTSLAAVVRAPEPPGEPIGLGGWAAALSGLAPAFDQQARAAQPPFREAVAQARAALSGVAPDRRVQQRTGVHRVADAVLFRLIEAVVHGLDLPQPTTPGPAAGKLVVRALAGLLAGRAPGRTVEVRVPPYAAVQCVEGPRHTRGTPPNVVEADPVSFLLLASGRLGWADAAVTGRVRASGERAATVAALLPLL